VTGAVRPGQKGAICAAKMRKKSPIMRQSADDGRVCVHTGTIPSKVMRKPCFIWRIAATVVFYGRATW